MPKLKLISILALCLTLSAGTPVFAEPLKTSDDYARVLMAGCIVDDLRPIMAKAAVNVFKDVDGFQLLTEVPGGAMLQNGDGIAVTIMSEPDTEIGCTVVIPEGVFTDAQSDELFEKLKHHFALFYGTPVDATKVSGGEIWQANGTKGNQLQVQFVRQDGNTVITARSTAREN